MVAAHSTARVVAFSASLLVTTSAWAYGGWEPMGFWQAYGVVVGRWLPGLAAFAALYVVFSFWVEKTRRTPLIPVLLHAVVSACIATPLGVVMGSPGPAHLVSDLNMLTFAAFCSVLWVKAAVLTASRRSKKGSAPPGPVIATMAGHSEGG